MKENEVFVDAVSDMDAAKMTADNKHGRVWPAGLYVIVDNERAVLESPAEADDLIKRIEQARDKLWPI